MKGIRATLIALSVAGTALAGSVPYEQRSVAVRAAYTMAAVVANVTPLSAVYASRCLPGYVLCKLSFAGVSLLAAADQLVFSGGADREQTRAILYRGFSGDWVLTGRHIAGDANAEPLPDPPAPAGGAGGHGGFEPPPI